VPLITPGQDRTRPKPAVGCLSRSTSLRATNIIRNVWCRTAGEASQ
jgi:hypothetical protein